MTRFRYLGDCEHVYLGPPVRVMSPGDVVELAHNPDPTMFEALPDSDASPLPGGAAVHGSAAEGRGGRDADPGGEHA